MDGLARPASSSVFIFKLAGACNLNCSYCYVYNLGDETWRDRPSVMRREVASAAIDRIFDYAREAALPRVAVNLHGGEPLLVGKAWMRWFLGEFRRRAPAGLRLDLAIQTNGTLLDAGWIQIFEDHGVGIGISMDGPAEWHDRYRVDHRGRGSYAKVARAVQLMTERGPASAGWGVLVVVNPEYPGTAIYEHLVGLGVRQMDFLWPDNNHDAPPSWPSGVLARYFIDLFDRWYGAGDPSVEIRFFVSAIRLLLGEGPRTDGLGPQPLTEVVIESDGSIEPLDVLRSCQNGLTRVALNVLLHPISAIYGTEIFQWCLDNQALLPEGCRACPVYDMCGGGYMPHRWGNGANFANASVHCADLLAVLSHIRRAVLPDLRRLGVAPGSEAAVAA